MDLIPMLILCGLALLAWTFIEPLLKTKLPPSTVVPVPNVVPRPVNLTPSEDARKVNSNINAIMATAPRWQKFDNLLQMRDDLVAAGHPEDEVAKTCAELAAKLLGVKK